MTDDRLDRWLPASLSAVWLAAVMLVNPVGDFPVTDDWSYAYAVRELVTRHQWHLNDWTSVPLATHVVWGALFCLPAGFSHTALRISTLVAAWAGGLGMYRLARTCGAAPRNAAVAALALLFCPAFFGLAFTFMTDVPFVTLTIWASVFAVRSIRRESAADAGAASAAFVAATLVRQLGAGAAIAAGAARAAFARSRRHGAAAGAAIALVPLAALALYNRVLAVAGTPALYHVRDGELASALAHPVGLLRLAEIHGTQALVYLGLFAVPVAWLGRGRTPRAARAAAAVVPAAALLLRGHWLPLNGGVIYNTGLNPTFIARGDLWPRTPEALWIALTAAGITAGAALGLEIAAGVRRVWRAGDRRARGVVVFCALAAAACLGPSIVLSNFFDRYVLATFAFALALAAAVDLWRVDAGHRLAAGAVALALLAAFDVTAVHDFLSYDRARWTAVTDLLAAGVPPDRLEGGYDVNGWIAYRPGLPRARGERWWDWSVQDPAARLSFGPIDGYRVTATYPFARWFGAGEGTVAVLRPAGARPVPE